MWSGLGYADAAAALGVPVGTVRSRLSRARRRLRKLAAAPEPPVDSHGGTRPGQREPALWPEQLEGSRENAARPTRGGAPRPKASRPREVRQTARLPSRASRPRGSGRRTPACTRVAAAHGAARAGGGGGSGRREHRRRRAWPFGAARPPGGGRSSGTRWPCASARSGSRCPTCAVPACCASTAGTAGSAGTPGRRP
ncbi:MAG: sigma factor-like helix-turn-helix DNA-binding protein [Micromonosporaceae bacterium]